MSKCKLIVNKLSGNADKVADLSEVEQLLREKYGEVDKIYIDSDNDVKMKEEIGGYDALAVCGGDGTLNSAVNAVQGTGLELVYVPCGTLNDTAKSLRLAKELSDTDRRIRRVDMGQIGDTMFAYVLAGGTFTEIGYRTKIGHKKKFKLLAYLAMVLKTYKIHRIKAKITLDGETREGEYTLIMAIKSARCFGFRFNKRFVHNDGKGQLLLIKSPRFNGIFGKIAIFFPFFRAFFMGLRKPINGKTMYFNDFRQATLEIEGETDFTVDGEKLVLSGENELKILRQKLNLVVY